MRCAKRLARAFALYEVLLGLAIFTIGVLVLGRAVGNCMRANTLSGEVDRARQILANRMAVVQAAPGFPDETKEIKIDTGHGEAKLIQRCQPAGLKDDKDLELSGIIHVALTLEWFNGNQLQTKTIEFYVYRAG